MRMRKIAWLAACLTTVGVLTGTARADAVPGYGVDTASNLYCIELSSATPTLIGNTGQFLEAIALTPDSTALFGTDTIGNLYKIDPATAMTTLVGNTGIGNIEGLHFLNDALLGVNFNSTPTIYQIDPATAVVTPVQTLLVATGAARALTVLDANTLLLVTDDPGGKALRTADLATGATTFIGNITTGANLVPGIDFGIDGSLYALDSNGNVLLVDPATAAATVIGNPLHNFWLDLASTPFSGMPRTAQANPEPSSILLLGLGAAGLLGYARCRRVWHATRSTKLPPAAA